ncbi:MAG: hypothetical protein COY81_01370 [Candidatus Pacebacteria bacterium CG_4_10_14_0_8_um_filter_43_12]|nr:MAG: hypothetical protein COY81_01370 [Candidatus Pacebacteria bacterium CG_4_10_14_0_8_um_filter_43_12]
MKQNDAKKIIRNVFNSEFNDDKFQVFISNLLKNFKRINKIVDNAYVKDSFKSFIDYYKVIGTFEDDGSQNTDILEVYLTNDKSLDRARTAQRNFIAEYLKSNGNQAALVAFIPQNKKDWRFSLIKLEHSLAVKNNRVITKEEITPAKRWSFLVGENEGSHTAQSRFVNLLVSNEKPNLGEFETAFNIEVVTNDFFEKYKELFLVFKENLDKLCSDDESIRNEFREKEIETADFAKKTMGQIVFLYFLQKKGWFGVAPNKSWGDGPKFFLRELFDRRSKYGKNFFNDVLEPLFYEALAQDRGKNSIYPKLNNCKMPFLNGGLFEPMNEYSWETININIPDEVFSNQIVTKDGDIGNGIFDVFERYNFTVNENEPLEKEVAVDPEMLGKVFENLLHIKDRKSKGAFYTPREIVHYMCQECLINYFEVETKDIPKKDIENFIHTGDRIIENDSAALKKIKAKEQKGYKYSGSYKLLLANSIISKAKELDLLLENIKVADPAVGSGAFPLGMINEIVRARKILNIYLDNNITDYQLKKHAISNSIYGVDIDPGAVEIAKLRLWLTLIVEETTPNPLPNLDHKIMQGNSLISEYEGVQLFDGSILNNTKSSDENTSLLKQRLSNLQGEYFELFGNNKLTPIIKIEIENEIKTIQKGLKSLEIINPSKGNNPTLFDSPEKTEIAIEKSNQLQRKTKEYVFESRRTQKEKLKHEIDDLKWELIEASFEEQGKNTKLEELSKLRHKNIKPFFVWKLEFSDVFRTKSGFDVVIGNPPYVGEKGNKETFQEIAKGNLGKFYQGKMDLFYFFFHLALDIGKENSINSFITTNYFITAQGAKNLRSDLRQRAVIRKLINFNELRIFQTALGQHSMITLFSKEKKEEMLSSNYIVSKKGAADENILRTILNGNDATVHRFHIKQIDLYEGNENYIRLRGINNFQNPIDKILEKMKIQGVDLGGKNGIANVNNGIFSGADTLNQKNKDKYNIIDAEIGDGIFILTNEEIKKLKLNEKEEKIVKPLYKNSDIYKYSTNNSNSLNILNLRYTDRPNIDDFPNIKNHLDKFKRMLINRPRTGTLESAFNNGYWYVMSTSRKLDFDNKKIVFPQRSKHNTFGYNEIPWYAASDVFFITEKSKKIVDLKYVLALLNSKLFYTWLYFRGKRKGETLELTGTPVSEIPIKEISINNQNPFIDMVDRILNITSKNDYNPHKPPIEQASLEKRIDQMIYELYGLTDEEIEIVEST